VAVGDMFDHFILTRFNVREPWTEQTEHPGLDAGWLKRRFELFERVCLPSMARQTNKSFHWLIFLDEETPDQFVRRLDELSSEHEFLIPIYCEDRREEFVLNEMKKRTSRGNTRIMTRLDNDDVIHPRMIEDTHSIARKQIKLQDLEQGFFISFPFGYSEHESDYYLQLFRCNPFVSFVSFPDYEKTIFGWDHTKIVEVAPVIFKYTWPMWGQVIHGENVANTVRGLYWPWGKCSNLIKPDSEKAARSFAWQCREFWRSFNRYIFHR